MASFDSPKEELVQDGKAKKIEFRFCKECANMLYPREDRVLGTLSFQCRNCQFSEDVGPVCIYRNELTNTVGETSGVTQDVASDPTVSDPVEPCMCTFCGQEILCPTCGEYTDGGQCLEVEVDDGDSSDDDATFQQEAQGQPDVGNGTH
ncbi:hypothetical protein ANO11243_030660 [Dothideomycetidae sp. 11243]|nr:hypothetical protein ANO11243_030660 [fungal sp. No.11243]